jgi:hypothetical protein
MEMTAASPASVDAAAAPPLLGHIEDLAYDAVKRATFFAEEIAAGAVEPDPALPRVVSPLDARPGSRRPYRAASHREFDPSHLWLLFV